MIQFKIFREHQLKGYTIGHLSYRIGDGEWVYFCDTLEDEVRPSGQKVYGETCIPFGQYKFILSQSVKFHRILPLILDVPGFVGVRIHEGNSNLDTSGCVLLGKNKEKGRVLESVVTLKAFMDLLAENPQPSYDLMIC